MQEEWRSIPGFEGFYEASSAGRIRRLGSRVNHWRPGHTIYRKGGLLKARPGTRGYMYICLCVNNKRHYKKVATLVCSAFHGPRPCGKEVAHLNGNRTDDFSSNLAWKTHTENEQDKRLHGTVPTGKRNGKYTKPEKTPRGEQNGFSKLTEDQVREIRRIYRPRHVSARMIAERFGVSKTQVLYIVKRKVWTHIQEAQDG